ncbi:MAG TPA: NRDE family protein [Nevskiaceae bacterium]|nr:NRDE family protein [Nevskiaceae bacterium]
MCLIAVAWKTHADLPLAMAANRDEFHDRPAAPAGWWNGKHEVFGGRDLSHGGSWLALSRHGRLAAITNIRRMIPPDPNAPSRGGLVREFVQSSLSAEQYADEIAERAKIYSGFNLLLYDGSDLVFCHNFDGFEQRALQPGIHVVSNATLDTPWPKSQRLRRAMQAFVNQRVASRNLLFSALADAEEAEDDELPNTGVGIEMERFLSPPFIRGDRYGTRCSTVVTINADGLAEFAEHRFGPGGAFSGESRENVQIIDGSLH